MSIGSKKFTAILVAAAAGAGTIAAVPAMAQDDRGGRGDRQRQPAPRPAPPPAQQQPGAGPVQQQPSIGVVMPDQPNAAAPATRRPGGVGALAPQPDDSAGPRAAEADTWLAQGTRRGRSFRVTCDLAATKVINPILLPGQDPGGHQHELFGGLSINASSTPASLVAANVNRDSTSCGQSRDGSAYWQDSLMITDDPANPVTIEPDEMRVRYSAPRGQRVRAFPAGFTMIAGDRTATALQQHAGWRCEYDAPGTPLLGTPPQCDLDEAIVGVVRFPNCWDGTTLTSATLPQPHVTYRTGSTCPSTHPVALPELVEEVFWPSDGQAHTYKISGASTEGIHAAFINGWDQRALRNQVRRWLNRRA